MAAGGVPVDIEASCAICGRPPPSAGVPECPHEGERLELALDQAAARWMGLETIRDWVLVRARNQVMGVFQALREARYQQHSAYLQTLPCYTVYQRFNGAPPIDGPQLQLLRSQIAHANAVLKAGVDEDWRRSCLEYPRVLDYYFSLVDFSFPSDNDPAVRNPRFGVGQGGLGGPAREQPRRVKARRDSMDTGSTKEHKKKKGRGKTPPPAAPMPGHYR